MIYQSGYQSSLKIRKRQVYFRLCVVFPFTSSLVMFLAKPSFSVCLSMFAARVFRFFWGIGMNQYKA